MCLHVYNYWNIIVFYKSDNNNELKFNTCTCLENYIDFIISFTYFLLFIIFLVLK
jgi:hypothetical protein